MKYLYILLMMLSGFGMLINMVNFLYMINPLNILGFTLGAVGFVIAYSGYEGTKRGTL